MDARSGEPRPRLATVHDPARRRDRPPAAAQSRRPDMIELADVRRSSSAPPSPTACCTLGDGGLLGRRSVGSWRVHKRPRQLRCALRGICRNPPTRNDASRCEWNWPGSTTSSARWVCATGAGFPGEVKGLVLRFERWSALSRPAFGIGQRSPSPLQLARFTRRSAAPRRAVRCWKRATPMGAPWRRSVPPPDPRDARGGGPHRYVLPRGRGG